MPKGRRDPESCLDVKLASNAAPEKKVKRNPEGKLPLGARKHEVEGSRSPSARPAALPIRTGLNALLRHSSPPPHRSPFSNHGVRLRPEITESRSLRNCGLCGSQTENPRYWPPPEPPPSASTSHTIKRNQTVRNPRGEKEKIRIKIPPVPENPN